MEEGGADTGLDHIANDILAKARTWTNTSGYSGDVDFHLRAYVTKSLKHHSGRLVDILKDQFASNKSHDDIQSYLSHMDDYLTQCCRQRTIQLTEQNENVDDLHKNHINDVHVGALKRYSSVLTQDLRIAGTLVLDNLVQSKTLSEAGRQSIVQRKTLGRVNSAFLKYCNGLSCTTFKEKVLPALKNSNDEVNVELANDIEKDIVCISTFGTGKALCVSCKIRNTVNYRRLADTLYEMNAISDNMREDLSSSNLSNETKWKLLLKKKHLKTLSLALKKKYPVLYREIQLTPQDIMHCTCCIDTEDEEDMEVDDLSDVARMSDISSRTNTTASNSERNFEISSQATNESINIFPDDRNYNMCSLWVQQTVTSKGASSSGSKSSQMESLNQQIETKPWSIHLTEKEREQNLQTNVQHQANQKKQHQGPLCSADVTLKMVCSARSKPRIYSAEKPQDPIMRPIHWIEKERVKIRKKKKSTGSCSHGSNYESSPCSSDRMQNQPHST